MNVEVRLDPGRLARALRSRNGVVARRLQARTDAVADIARAQAPGSMGEGIVTRVEAVPKGLAGVITSTHPASVYVLGGTRPHRIRARRAKALRFEAGGGVLFRKEVMHPGTRANNFLLRALEIGR